MGATEKLSRNQKASLNFLVEVDCAYVYAVHKSLTSPKREVKKALHAQGR